MNWEKLTREVKLRKIRKYAWDFAEALVDGKVPKPSSGDCFGCGLTVVGSGESMGDVMGGEHCTISHIEESYFVPSLLMLAVNEVPVSDFARHLIGCAWSGTEFFADNLVPLMKRQIRRSLRNYIKKRILPKKEKI